MAFDSCADALAGLQEGRARRRSGRGASAGGAIAVDGFTAGGVAPQRPPHRAGGRLGRPRPRRGTPAPTPTRPASTSPTWSRPTAGGSSRSTTACCGSSTRPRVRSPAARHRRRRDDPARWAQSQLLLHGDRALVLMPDYSYAYHAGRSASPATGWRGGSPRSDEVMGPKLMLVDLSGAPRIVSSFRIDGSLVDARQVGQSARVVVRSAPRLEFPMPQGEDKRTDKQRLTDNRKVISKSTVEDWLPRYGPTPAGRSTSGRIDCGEREPTGQLLRHVDADRADVRPRRRRARRRRPDHDRRRRRHRLQQRPQPVRGERPALADRELGLRPSRLPTGRPATDIYRFDTSQPGRPQFVASGSVPAGCSTSTRCPNGTVTCGWPPPAACRGATRPTSSSAVYVLRTARDALVRTGEVGGLGKGERIYSVRFAGTAGTW